MKKHLKWPTLQQRRFVNRQTLFYKTQNNTAMLEIPEYFSVAGNSLRSGNAIITHNVPIQGNSNQYLYSCMSRTIQVWDLIPVQVAMATTSDHCRDGLWSLITT